MSVWRNHDASLRPPSWYDFVALGVGLVRAQVGGGSLTGSALDPTGAAIAGAKIQATNQETKVTQETLTNSEGYYEFPLLPPGRYILQAEHSGFQTGRSAEFSLNSGTRPRIDLKLLLGAVTEQVQVTATAPVVNTTTTDLGVVMTRERIESLPLNGRNYQTWSDCKPARWHSPRLTPDSVGGWNLTAHRPSESTCCSTV